MNLINHHITKQTLVAALNEKLEGSDAHFRMLPNGRKPIPDDHSKVKYSAVMMLFYLENENLMMCLTRRNERLKHHPGQISFPGGRCEPHENDNPLLTALRETQEEIGVDPNEIEILGRLSALYVSVSNFIIHPYIGWIGTAPNFVMNEHEVDEIMTIQTKLLFEPQNQIHKPVETSMGIIDVPCYFVNEYVIWGATSMMIAELEEKLKQYCFRLA